jgi:hypothetical protein
MPFQIINQRARNFFFDGQQKQKPPKKKKKNIKAVLSIRKPLNKPCTKCTTVAPDKCELGARPSVQSYHGGKGSECTNLYSDYTLRPDSERC